MDKEAYWAARQQEEAHATSAALQLVGIDMSWQEVVEHAKRAAGGHSYFTIMACVRAFFSMGPIDTQDMQK